jgi:hypothetical protein
MQDPVGRCPKRKEKEEKDIMLWPFPSATPGSARFPDDEAAPTNRAPQRRHDTIRAKIQVVEIEVLAVGPEFVEL